MKDWGATFTAAFACLQTGGFLGIEDLVFREPSPNLAPDSIWHHWKQALNCLKDRTGFSFVLHDNGRAQDELRKSGYEIVSEDVRKFYIRPKLYVYDGCDLHWSILELMKGVLARAWEPQPPMVDEQTLMDHVEGELGRGLQITG